MSSRHASPEIDGPKLRELRKMAGLTITELSSKVGCSISYLAAIERGHRPTVAPSMYARICEAMGIEDRGQLLRQPTPLSKGGA